MIRPTVMTKAKCGRVITNTDLCQVLSRVYPVKGWSQTVIQKARLAKPDDYYWVLWQQIAVQKTRVNTMDTAYRHRQSFWSVIENRPLMSSLRDHWSVVEGGRRGAIPDGGNGELPLLSPTDYVQNEFMAVVAVSAAGIATFNAAFPGDMGSDSSNDYSSDDPRDWNGEWLTNFYGLQSLYNFQVKFVIEAVKVGNQYGSLQYADEASDAVLCTRDNTQTGTNPFLFKQLSF